MMVNEMSSRCPIDANFSVNLSSATIATNDIDDDDKSETSSSSDNNDKNLKFPDEIVPSNTRINVESSSDVIVGPVTHFHDSVIIYNNPRNNTQLQQCDSPSYLSNTEGTEKCPDISNVLLNSSAKLVTSEASSGNAVENTQLSRKKLTYLSLILLFSIILILIIISIIVGTVAFNNHTTDSFDVTEHTSNSQLSGVHKLIYRDRWGGRKPLYTRPQKLPVEYVIIAHSAGQFCDTVPSCSIQMVQMQSQHVQEIQSPDIGYNFVIGGDGNIYVGRDWDAHNFFMKLDTIGICFIGNYIYDTLTAGMIEAAQELLQWGVDNGKLIQNYTLVGHNQTYNTISPGPNIMRQIKFWPHYSPEYLIDN